MTHSEANENYPIDFVVTWLDGNDPAWQAEKAQYMPEEAADNTLKRFRNWENLQYWLRGIEEFTPWVNKVFIVTWGHVPEWLDTSNPRLRVVRHDEFMPEAYRPTFSSVPIELNLHRIEDLSEHFVFFCDDYFILKPMPRSDFFKNGLPCDTAVVSPNIPIPYSMINHILLNEVEIANKYFTLDQVKKARGKWYSPKYGTHILRTLLFTHASAFCGFTIEHIPQSFLKSTFEEVWGKEGEFLDGVSQHKFRTKEDVSQFLMKIWQLCSNRFEPRKFGIGDTFNVSPDNSDIIAAITGGSLKCITINDSDDVGDFETSRDEINAALDSILPNKSSFER